MSTTTIHKESFYQAKIIKWLKEQYPGAFVWKAQAGPYCRQGIPDICAIIDGHFFGFEVKRPELGRLSKIQEQTLKEIDAAGGTTAVVSYPEEVERAILIYKASLPLGIIIENEKVKGAMQRG